MEREAVLTVFDLLGDAKVRDLDTALVVDEHVRALDVAVYDVALVEVTEAEQDLAHPVAHERLFEGAVVTQQRGNRASGDVLEENVEMITINA